MTANVDTWFSREQARLSSESPRTWAVLHWLLSHRLLLIVAVTAIGGGLTQLHTLGTSDTTLYLAAGRHLLSHDGINVFSDPTIQIGPLYLLVLGLLSLLAQALSLPAAFVAGCAQAALVTSLSLHLVRRLALSSASGTPASRDLGVSLSLICGPLAIVGVAGHFEEPLVALFLLLSVERMLRGSDAVAVLWLLAATGFKLWGALGVAILLLAASPAAWVRRGLGYGLGCLACYLPFFAFGSVNTFHLAWPVWPSATVGWFMTGAFTYQLRLAQCAGVLLVTAALALRLRSNAWLVPTVAIATRLLLDPEQVYYYWSPLVLCLAVGLWANPPLSTEALCSWTTLGAAAALVLPYVLVAAPALSTVHTIALIAVVAGAFVAARRPRANEAGSALPG